MKRITIIVDGQRIDPPEGYRYRGTDPQGHYWVHGYAVWRPPASASVTVGL